MTRAVLRRTGAVIAMLALTCTAACGGGPGVATPGGPVLDDPAAQAEAGIASLRPEVLGTLAHDRSAYTEGFEIDGDTLWEGTGLEGRSQLRALDPATGALRRAVDLPPDVFGEGVTVTAERIWQLTWKDGDVYDRSPQTLAITRTLPYDREGWGMCHYPDRVVTSDGSDELVTRDPRTFAPLRSVRVSAAGTPVTQLNELECTPDGVLANVYQTDRIVRVEPDTGRVTAVVDAAGLLPEADRAGVDVLNGIAAIPGTDQYLLAGKLWPTTFRVRFVPR